MPTHGTTSGTIEILLRRIETSRSVLDGPKSKPTLADEVKTSRSTVDRVVEKLASVVLVEYGKDSSKWGVQTNQAYGQRSERVVH